MEVSVTQDQIKALSDQELRAIVASTRPDGSFASEVEWSKQELDRRGIGYIPLAEIAQRHTEQFRRGIVAFQAGEPISNSPRTGDTRDAKCWRDGWLHAREGRV
jgi:hypothetical protein